MKEKYIKDYFDYLLTHKEQLSNDETALRDFLSKHFANLPNGKLYKYRSCNTKNFEVLANNQIYVPFAKKFYDEFDTIINLDIFTKTQKFKKWLYQNVDILVYLMLKSQYKEKHLRFNVRQSQIKNVREICFDKKGKFIEKNFDKIVQDEKQNYQCKNIIKLINSVFDEGKEYKELLADLKQKTNKSINKLQTFLRNKLMIYCFTQSKDNRKMWEDYADNYSGFCIEYDFTNLDKYSVNELKTLVNLLPVLYQKRKPKFDLIPLLDIALQKCIGKKSKVDLKESEYNLVQQILSKHPDYDFEDEWRLFLDKKNINISKNKLKFPFVSAIYLGHKISKENEKNLKEIANKLNISLYKQKKDLYNNMYIYKKQ